MPVSTKTWATTTEAIEHARTQPDDGKESDGNEEGQAISLHQLSMLYRLTEDYATALARSQEAEALARKLGIEAHVAATLHEQGLIYNRMARAAAPAAAAATASKPSPASSRAWRSSAASATRPARPTRWANWASC